MAAPIEESATGTVDGVNDTFDTSAAYRPTTLKAFLNGVFNLPVTELGGTSFSIDGDPPQPGDTIAVYYFT
jgi:hypothetical protein